MIFVKTLSGRTLTLDVAADESVSSIKSLIAARYGVAAESQRLICAGELFSKLSCQQQFSGTLFDVFRLLNPEKTRNGL